MSAARPVARADLRPALVKALSAAEAGRISEARSTLLDAAEAQPLASGAADALYHLGVMEMVASSFHRQEVFCLVTHRLRATQIEPDITLHNLVNLARACLNLKSFEEAYRYGCMGERLCDHDPDLLANMLALELLLERPEPARRRLERLREVDPSRVAYLSELLAGKTSFRPTRDVDGAELVRRFDGAPTDVAALHHLVADLEKLPDCRGASRCWRKLAALHAETMAVDRTLALRPLMSAAGVVAAAGKAIASSDDEAAGDAQLWGWYGLALSQLALYDHAVVALDRALAQQKERTWVEAQHEARRLAALPEDAVDRPDSRAHLERLRVAAGLGPPEPADAADPWLDPVRSELAAVHLATKAGLDRLMARVTSLRTRLTTTPAGQERDAWQLALVHTLGAAGFAALDRDPSTGEALVREAVALCQALRKRLGDERAEHLEQQLTTETLSECEANLLSEASLYASRRGDLTGAEAQIREAVRRCPDSPKLRCNLAAVLMSREEVSRRRNERRCNEILDELEEAQRLGPYATTIKMLDAMMRWPGLPADVAARGAELHRAIELGTRPPVRDRPPPITGPRLVFEELAHESPSAAALLRRARRLREILQRGSAEHVAIARQYLAKTAAILAAQGAARQPGVDRAALESWLIAHAEELDLPHPARGRGPLLLLAIFVAAAAIWWLR